MLFVHLAEPSAGRNEQVEDFFGGRLVAFENGVFRLSVVILYCKSSDAQLGAKIAYPRRNRFDVRQFANRQGIVIGKFLAGPHFFGGPTESERFQVEGKNDVRAN